MKRHIQVFHSEKVVSAPSIISENCNPFANKYGTHLDLDNALDFGACCYPLSYCEMKASRLIANSPHSFKAVSLAKVRESIISHATRIQRNKLAELKGKITLAINGSRLKNGEIVYAVCAIKNGKSYYLAAFHKDVPKTGSYLATELTALINELKDNDVEVVGVVTDNGKNLLKASELLAVPRVACICHGLNLIIKDILPEKKTQRSFTRIQRSCEERR